jgi:hypothetical protein
MYRCDFRSVSLVMLVATFGSGHCAVIISIDVSFDDLTSPA